MLTYFGGRAFQDGVSLFSPDSLRTHSVDHANLEFTDPPAFAS